MLLVFCVLFAVVLFTVDTGTAVTILFTSDVDLFFAEALLLARRKVGLSGVVRSGVRRVLTFPSGLVWEMDLYFLVSLCGICARFLALVVVVAVRRGEDAERDGDSGFKIQDDCLAGRESPLLLPFKMRKEEKDFSGFCS